MDKSVHELITELCEKHIDKRKCIYENINIQPLIKKLRTKAFEVLLKKKHLTECVNELEGNSDSICHLLAWQYTLRHDLNQPENAESLGVFIEQLKNSDILQDKSAHNMIIFLLYLRGSRPPNQDSNIKYDIFNKVTLKHKSCTNTSAFPYDIYQNHKFQFPYEKSPTNDRSLTNFSLKSFNSEPCLTLSIQKLSKSSEKVLSYSSNYKFDFLRTKRDLNIKEKSKSDSTFPDEGYESPVRKNSSENIWEIASKLPINEHRTWESLDCFDPIKELPFACESGQKTLHLFHKILKANTYNFINDENPQQDTIISNTKFVKCVKYMLVGMTSDVFLTNSEDLFYLKEGICIEGLSTLALKSYCCDLIFCGSSYRSLNNLCTPYAYRNNDKNGYIFKELCESIKRYLAYYRVAALSISDTATLLTIHSHMRTLKAQMNVLTRLCKVAMHSGGPVLQGAELLNYMYQEITKTVDANIALVLYSAFYPCCQIYFSRFLQRWLFEGVLIDPYEEFIIKSETDYINSRGRIYWTRSFSLQHHSVPEFLSDLKFDILQCGKTMNLLKLCNPDASLYTHIMSRSLPLISCCLTPEHSARLKQEIDCYYIEMASLCGPRISLYHILRDRYGNEENSAFLSLVEKKRALTFKEMELRKQQEAEERAKHKRKIFEEMREQMNLAAEQKKKIKEDDLKRDLVIAQQNAQIEELRSDLVKEESKVIIKYYTNLIEAVDKRRNSLELRKQKLLDTTLDLPQIEENKTPDEQLDLSDSEEIFHDARDDEASPKSTEVLETEEEDINKNVDTSPQPPNLDLVNANIENESKVELQNQRNENFRAAQRNRAKIMNLEFNVNLTKIEPIKPINISNSNLTELQRNKLKVLSSEFDIFYDVASSESIINATTSDQPSIVLTNEENNGNKIETNSNLASPGHEDVMNLFHRRRNLKLPKPNELLTIYETENKVKNEIIPMSIDSTPNTEYSLELPTPSSAKLSLNTDIIYLDSALLTTNSNITDDGFKFPDQNETKKHLYENTNKLLFTGTKKICSITENIPISIRPMRLSKNEVEQIKNGNLKSLLYQSVYIPLEAQMKLVNSEILKYFINEQNFFSHLNSLRCYYFLLDGEFGRNITEGLFTKLYESKNPADLLNCRSLQLIINTALYASSKHQENGEKLSFIVRNIPEHFDLSNAEVFDCLSLSYRINWPLNILLPFDTIEKYDIVFKYLLKLHHMSWTLKKMAQDLKNSQKEYGIDETVLMNSPQYHKIQLFRHVMTHFVQTLQNYTQSEVLQTSWEELEKNLQTVNTLDQLYTIHIVYIKTIMFRCLLNKKCAPIMKVIREIFVVILKFYNYLRCRSWNLKANDIYYTHPNFKKLEDIFNKFGEFTNFVFRVGNKMARVGYQPHLIQMLDMLNVNDYYANKQKK